MPEEKREIEGPGVDQPGPDDLEQHPQADMCQCGHPLYRHGKDKDGKPIPDGPDGPMCQRARYCGCTGFRRGSMELVVTKPEHRKEYELIRQMGHLAVEDWPDARILAVRQMYANEARNSAQLAMFLDVAGKHMLDPALNEVQLIQTDKGPKVYAGRDGFLRSASYHKDMYGGIQSGVVYLQDDFRVKVYADASDPTNVIVDIFHEFDPRKRTGRPHGAYCVVFDAKGHPTYVYRETKKCENVKSHYWKDDSVDDAIHNRAIAGCLRRVIPLGGLLIHGEDPLGGTRAIEEEVAKGTRQQLRNVRARLGLGAQEEEEAQVHVDGDGRPDPEEIDALLDEFSAKYRVPVEAFVAWAKSSGAVPDDLAEWGVDEKTVALHEMQASEGLDFIREWATALTASINSTSDRLDMLGEIVNCQDRAKLDELVERLKERAT